MEEYFYKYKGIIVQNDDPEGMNRVKVWVPQVNMTLYKNWNEDRDNDKIFTKHGANVNSAITPEFLQRLKEALPWGTVLQPILGMGSSVTYHNDKHMSEIGNDGDNSNQHNVINKLPESEAQENIKTDQLAQAMSNSAVPPTDNAAKINNFSNPSESNSTISYVQNAINTSNGTTPVIPSPSGTSNTSSSTTGSNISKITFTFNPNQRNATNFYRRFTTSAQIFDTSGSFNANSSATGAKTGFTQTFQTSTPSVGQTSIDYSPPITYTQNPNPPKVPIVQNVSVVNSGSPASRLTVSGNATTAPNVTNTDSNGVISVVFSPNNRNFRNTHRTFTTTASIIVLAGSNIIVDHGNNNQTVINQSDITGIEVEYNVPSEPINFGSSQLGQLSNLFGQYTNDSGSGIQSEGSSISPPSPISSQGYNRGGGGSELFALAFSNLLPFKTMLSTLVGQANPLSKQTTNYKRPIDNGSDGSGASRTTGQNQQTSADCGPPMRSPTQSNKVKGTISIPAVGAHVSVYFDNGNPLFPIVDGFFYTKEDILGIHDATRT